MFEGESVGIEDDEVVAGKVLRVIGELIHKLQYVKLEDRGTKAIHDSTPEILIHACRFSYRLGSE